MKSAKIRRCEFCNSEEGKIRKIGGFKVELKALRNDHGDFSLACQSCYRKTRRILKTNIQKQGMIMNLLHNFRNVASSVFAIAVLSLFFTDIILAQGLPGFPAQPDAAPIDGGLGILAAAGGAYALKKLRDKNKEEEIE